MKLEKYRKINKSRFLNNNVGNYSSTLNALMLFLTYVFILHTYLCVFKNLIEQNKIRDVNTTPLKKQTVNGERRENKQIK